MAIRRPIIPDGYVAAGITENNELIVKKAATRKSVNIVPEVASQRFFPSGCALLDCVLGGGWAHGKVINVVGDKSTGKTLLAIEASANYVRSTEAGEVDYVEAESAFDPAYARTIGFPEHRLNLIDDINTVERLWGHIEGRIAAKDKTPRLVIVDSLDALSDQAELDREIGDASYGAAKSKLLSEGFRKLIREMADSNITLFVISQIRDKMNAMAFAKKVQRSGGHALDFYASQVLWLYEEGKLKKKVGGIERAYGVEVKARCEKNKVGWPWRECVVPIIYGFGMDDKVAALEWLLTAKPEAAKDIHPSIEKGNYKRYIRDVPRETIAALVSKVWEEVDKEFRPTESKYS